MDPVVGRVTWRSSQRLGRQRRRPFVTPVWPVGGQGALPGLTTIVLGVAIGRHRGHDDLSLDGLVMSVGVWVGSVSEFSPVSPGRRP
jgi:hypothetical protein